MAEFVLMPKLGFNMETGQIVAWHKQEGESIKKGDVLVEISTDKTVMEIESTLEGTVRKLLVVEGDTVPVILPIAIIGGVHENIEALLKEAMAQLGKTEEDGAADSQAAEILQAEQPADQNTAAGVAVSTDLKLSPKAKVYLKRNKLDISGLDIKGTGFQGGVTAEDIEAYVKSNPLKITPLAEKIAAKNNVDVTAIEGTGIGGKITKADVLGVTGDKKGSPAAESFSAGGSDDRAVLKTISYSGMRKVIGDRLSQSKFTAPHLYFTTSVDVSALLKLRQDVNSAQDVKVSVNDFIIGAVVKALQEYPELNSSLQGDKIVQYADVNIGIAVALETGLIVPVVKKAQTKKITRIAQEGKALADKARNGKLTPDKYQGGTFTVSNLGMFGIVNFTAIINPPEAGILSVSAVKKTPVVVEEDGEDKIVIRPMMNMTITVDHRIIDGLVATRFITRVKDLLEKPFNILV